MARTLNAWYPWTCKIRVIVSDDAGDDDELPYHTCTVIHSYIVLQAGGSKVAECVTWRGILSISCMDGCVHACVHCMDVLWNWPSKRKRCQCVLGPSSELSDVRLAWGRHGEGTEKGEGEEVLRGGDDMGKEFERQGI